MANLFNDDFREFIQELNKQEVEYLLVGGYAVILHGYRRSTGGLDVWVNITVGNYKKLVQAFLAFVLPTEDISEDIFLRNDEMDVFTYGVPPVCIDVMKKVKGCDFDEAYKMSKLFDENGLQIRYVHIDTLIKSKIASGRYKDLDDIEKLSG